MYEIHRITYGAYLSAYVYQKTDGIRLKTYGVSEETNELEIAASGPRSSLVGPGLNVLTYHLSFLIFPSEPLEVQAVQI